MLDHMAQRQPPMTILDVEAAERLAEKHDFEKVDSTDKGYKLVAAITTIMDGCMKEKPDQIPSMITEETR
ncbi:hypothetical protein Aduo_009097 [Ancylostoma duodenale]